MTYEAVVLAAGRSSRAGTFKPALDCGGVPLIRRVVRAFARVCRRTWVVTGYQADQVAALVAGEPGVETVYHPTWEQGMFSSVRAGVARVTSDRFFVTPGDLPLVDRGLVQALAETSGSLVVPVWGHETGHPILLDAVWARAISAAAPGSTLRDVLAGTPKTRVPAPDDGILRDIDTCEDYEEMRELLGRSL
jgi:molybdenum cofactor cytidylyltransferase